MKILSVGYAVPGKKVTNEDILNQIEERSKKNLTPEDWEKLKTQLMALFKRSGTETRYHRAEGEIALDFGIKAGQQALDKAGLSPGEIDLVLYVGIGRGWIEPATCNVFLDVLKLKNATGFDIIDACASWLRALQMAYLYIKSKAFKNVMIINCEFNFKEYASVEYKSINEVEYYFPGHTIGEAATATILTECPENEFYFIFKTWGEKLDLCMIPLPNLNQFLGRNSQMAPLKFYSYGEKLFKVALSKICRHYLEDQYLSKMPYDIMFSHSASEAMTEKVIRLANLDLNKSYSIHASHGNTVSASVPLAMGLAIDDGTLKKGDNVLIGFGSAGFSSAWCCFKYL